MSTPAVFWLTETQNRRDQRAISSRSPSFFRTDAFTVTAYDCAVTTTNYLQTRENSANFFENP